MTRTPFILMLATCLSLFSHAQAPRYSVQDYIDNYKDLAVREMEEYRIPASITLAQGILESANGNSELATRANNHFGIKCHTGWTGKTYHMDDDRRHECFRKYGSVEESYRDHSLFLSTRSRYSHLFELDIEDYKGWAMGLKEAGYATNPRYPDLLIRIIEENQLYLFDKKADNYLAEGGSGNETSPAADTRDFQIAGAPNGRMVYLNNGIKFIVAGQGETPESIASSFGIYSWQVRKYNELGKKDRVTEGQIIYLEKKKKKAKKEIHVVEDGQDLRQISQIYGIRLNALAKKNKLSEEARLEAGQKIQLR